MYKRMKRGKGLGLELRIRDVLGREWPVSRLCVIQHEKDHHSLSTEQAERSQQRSDSDEANLGFARSVYCFINRAL